MCHMHKLQTTRWCILNSQFGILDVLEDLDVNDDDSIVVTLVPQYGKVVVINRLVNMLRISKLS